jgi:hypothetical protein
MNFEEWANFVTSAKEGIKARMEELCLSPAKVAPLANLAERTVRRFVDGLTFQPSLRTAVSCSAALNGSLEDWERAMFMDPKRRPTVVRSMKSLRNNLRREGFDGVVIDKKEKGVIFNHGRRSFLVQARPEKVPLSVWIELAMKVKNGRTNAKISVAV